MLTEVFRLLTIILEFGMLKPKKKIVTYDYYKRINHYKIIYACSALSPIPLQIVIPISNIYTPIDVISPTAMYTRTYYAYYLYILYIEYSMCVSKFVSGTREGRCI